ncbi:hypothetical protein ACWDWO_07830 [Actinopolymorpha singaporensis]
MIMAQASFTGTWRGVTLWPEDYDIAVPYVAWFEARHGTGLGSDKWSTVTVKAKITAATRPVPTVAPQVAQRTAEQADVLDRRY